MFSQTGTESFRIIYSIEQHCHSLSRETSSPHLPRYRSRCHANQCLRGKSTIRLWLRKTELQYFQSASREGNQPNYGLFTDVSDALTRATRYNHKQQKHGISFPAGVFNEKMDRRSSCRIVHEQTRRIRLDVCLKRRQQNSVACSPLWTNDGRVSCELNAAGFISAAVVSSDFRPAEIFIDARGRELREPGRRSFAGRFVPTMKRHGSGR